MLLQSTYIVVPILRPYSDMNRGSVTYQVQHPTRVVDEEDAQLRDVLGLLFARLR